MCKSQFYYIKFRLKEVKIILASFRNVNSSFAYLSLSLDNVLIFHPISLKFASKCMICQDLLSFFLTHFCCPGELKRSLQLKIHPLPPCPPPPPCFIDSPLQRKRICLPDKRTLNYLSLGTAFHYENMPIQIHRTFHLKKMESYR